MADQQFSDPDPVEEILRLALRNKTTEDSSLRDRLLASAAELGISEDQALAAQKEWQERKEREEEVSAYRKHIKNEFRSHFWSYLAINAILLTINLLTHTSGHDYWVKWPIGVWGVILVVHAMVAIGQIRQPNGDEFEAFRRVRAGEDPEPEALVQRPKVVIGVHVGSSASRKSKHGRS